MMSGRLRRGLHDLWGSGGSGGAGKVALGLLAPAELPFRLAVAARNARYEREPAPPTPIPVVSVGNLTVGGTGKTPVVRWLGEWFRGAGVPAAIVVRGYGADEVALYRRWFGDGAVFVGRDRIALVDAAAERGHRLALLDDGFQHRRLGRALDLLLVAAEDPWPVRMLPRGPYREPLASAARATHLLVTRRTASRERVATWRERLRGAAPGVPGQVAELRMGGWRDLGGSAAEAPAGDILAVASIARPQAFLSGLEALLPGVRAELAGFADHHVYTARDVAGLLGRRGDRTVVCTAKDAVKLASFPEMRPHCVVVGFRVAGEPQEPLRSALAKVGGCASR